VAHRRDAPDDAVGCHRLAVEELGALERPEAGHVAEGALTPVVVVAPGCAALDPVHDRPHLVHPRLASITRVPHESEPPAPAERPPQLTDRAVVVEPVPRLRGGGRVERLVGERESFGRARDHRHAGQNTEEDLAHPGDGLQGDEVGSGAREQARELAGARRQVADPPAGPDAEPVDEPCDGLAGIRGPGGLVVGRVAEPRRRYLVHHDAILLCRPRYGPGYPARSTLGTPASSPCCAALTASCGK
jgi:hypothetical protein